MEMRRANPFTAHTPKMSTAFKMVVATFGNVTVPRSAHRDRDDDQRLPVEAHDADATADLTTAPIDLSTGKKERPSSADFAVAAEPATPSGGATIRWS